LRKIIFLALSTIFISLLLFGCQSKENVANETYANQSAKSKHNTKLSMDNDIRSISVSKTKGVDEITIEDKKSIHAFLSIFSSAVKEPGIVNMTDPEFYLKVVYDKSNHESLSLWIGEKGQRSAFMKTEDITTIYTVSEEMTDELIELVKSRFN